MIGADRFLNSIMSSISEHIVVIDQAGMIQFVNKAWVVFSQANSCLIEESGWWRVNYLQVCDDSAAAGEEYGTVAGEGIREVIKQSLSLFSLEYPCHSPEEKRWFMMKVTPFQLDGLDYCTISHQNVTDRKCAEEQVLNLSRIDGLTKLPNRRYFDDFLETEWKRCVRSNLPITIAILDIDYFKLLNDHYGHQAGDECLIKVGIVLNELGKRPGELFARYGGEEFSLIFGNTTAEQSLVVINRIVEAISQLKIPNEKSPIKSTLTVSVGLAMAYPNKHMHTKELIGSADKQLYLAKNSGRDRVAF